MPNFYTPNLTEKSTILKIEGAECNHISKVFRHKVGDVINLNSGNGYYAKAEIVGLNKKEVSCKILSFVAKLKYNPNIAVAFSLLRNKNDNLLVEKLTELGVAEFFPFESEFTVRKASKNTTEKFNITAIGAIKQCDNGYLPIMNDTLRLKAQIERIIEKGYLPVIASEKEEDTTILDIMKRNSTQPLCIFIGPEGGFSDSEFAYFHESSFIQYKLGINILRAETAAICAVSQLITSYL